MVFSKTILVLTIDILRHYGWCQGCSQNNGAVCLVEAIGRAVDYTQLFDLKTFDGSVKRTKSSKPARDLLLKTIGCDSLVKWNDSPGRTRKEVMEALYKAIESN